MLRNFKNFKKRERIIQHILPGKIIKIRNKGANIILYI